jgi:hypothetical protein
MIAIKSILGISELKLIYNYLQDDKVNELINDIHSIQSQITDVSKNKIIDTICESKKLNISKDEYKQLVILIFNIKKEIKEIYPTINKLDNNDIQIIINNLKEKLVEPKQNLDETIVKNSVNDFVIKYKESIINLIKKKIEKIKDLEIDLSNTFNSEKKNIIRNDIKRLKIHINSLIPNSYPEVDNDDNKYYYEKYLKYKTKYLQLKNLKQQK